MANVNQKKNEREKNKQKNEALIGHTLLMQIEPLKRSDHEFIERRKTLNIDVAYIDRVTLFTWLHWLDHALNNKLTCTTVTVTLDLIAASFIEIVSDRMFQ